MEFDEFLIQIGQFGKYQRIHYILLCFSSVFVAFNVMTYVFVAAVPEHWCKTPDFLSNLTLEQRKAFSIPKKQTARDITYSQCEIYNFSSVNVHEYTNNSSLENLLLNMSLSNIVKCSEWEYDVSEYSNTIVSQWNLVCGKEWIAATSAAVYAVGQMIGCLVFGYVSDRIGRRKTLLLGTFANCVIGVASAFSPEPVTYLLSRLILASVSMAVYEAAFVLGMEIVGPDWRVFAGIAIVYFWAFGYLIVAGMAYFIRDWIYLQIATHAPIMLFFFLFLWLTPESPRWLLRMGRKSDAEIILQRMMSVNGVKNDIKLDTIHVAEQNENVTIPDLLKSDMMVVLCLVCSFLWFCTSLTYYGLSLNTSNLGGNSFLNFAISGAVEIPAYCLCIFLLYKVGRRISHICCYGIAGICLLSTSLVPDEMTFMTIILSMIGKFAISAAFAMIYVYTSELYPTTRRTVGLGFSSTCARIGSIAAPYMAMLGNISAKTVPLVLFGVLSLVAAFGCLLLPETKYLTLPDTMEDLQRFEQAKFSCKCNSTTSDSVEPTRVGDTELPPQSLHELINCKEDEEHTCKDSLLSEKHYVEC